MAERNNFLLNISILYRSTMKYFDKALARYDIGSGQIFFLFMINENEGITMQELTRLSEVDKGTTTKSIARLIDKGYVEMKVDETDRRVRRLYMTPAAAPLLQYIYEQRLALARFLAREIDFERFETDLDQVCENARQSNAIEHAFPGLRIGAMQESSLTAWPGRLSAVVELAGCDYKCPYCSRRSLVFIPENYAYLDTEEVLGYLQKRSSFFDGVVISGGEPLLQGDLIPFMKEVRQLGCRIRLETSGSLPERLAEVIRSGLVDEVAMDLKSTPEKYPAAVGMNQAGFSFEPVKASMRILEESGIRHEYVTTCVRDLHTEQDIMAIAEMIDEKVPYVLRKLERSGRMIAPEMQGFSDEEMKVLLASAKQKHALTSLRGVWEDQ